MADEIDPRLRALGDGGNPTFAQQSRNPYSNSLSQLPVPPHQASESSNTSSLRNTQNHNFYPALPTTPQSFYPGTHLAVNSTASQYDEADEGSADQPQSGPGQYTPDTGTDNNTARSRACEACRSLKVRCEPDPANPEGTCKRCGKAGRQCVVTMPNRKRQKKTDSRVAELEKKIDALTASLHATRDHNPSQRTDSGVETQPSAYPPPDQPQSIADVNRDGWMGQVPGCQDGVFRQSMRGVPTPPTLPGSKRKRSQEMGNYAYTLQTGNLMASPSGTIGIPRQQSSTPTNRETVQELVDVIDRQIIDHDTAQRMFERYTKEMAPQLPVVVFSPGTLAADIRRKKPILFLAILSISAGTIRPDLQQMFIEETHRLFAERIMIKGQKSLELIQALLVSTLWYQPPEQYEELKFYQLIHIAATMGFDIGMGKRSKPAEKKFMGMWKDNSWKKSNVPDPDSPETRRTWLGCYFVCANAAMALRRPILIRWLPYMDECVEMLEAAADSYPSDKALCQWIKLQHIAEEVAFQFSMDDPTGFVALSDTKTQYALKGFKGQLNDWRKGVTEEQYTSSLMLCDHVTNLFVHEVAMHTDDNGEDFKPPYSDPKAIESSHIDIITPAQIGALTNCLTSIHDIFDTFLSFSVDHVRNLPTIHLVRTTYSGVALIKLYSSVTAPGSKLEKVFNPDDLRVEYYLDSILDHLSQAAEDEKSRAAAKFLQILGMLKTWYRKRKDGQAGNTSSILASGPASMPALSASDSSTSQWSASTPPEASIKLEKARNTPLHLLSAVAMGDPNAAGNMEAGGVENGEMYKNPMQGFGMEGNMMEHMGFAGGDLDQAMGLGFGADDISALFMDDPFLQFPLVDTAQTGFIGSQNF